MEELLKLLHLPIHTKQWQPVTGSTGGLQVGAESLAVSLQAVATNQSHLSPMRQQLRRVMPWVICWWTDVSSPRRARLPHAP